VVSVVVTLGYDLPWRRIHELMQQACARVEALEAAPLIRQCALQNFAVEYELVARVTPGKPVPAAHSALHAAMQDVFNEAKMEILTPDVLQLRQGVPPSV
jgi:small-conductance mechanosensitive channel